jgi:glycosyltransferase involved in cell wall biosynthesis
VSHGPLVSVVMPVYNAAGTVKAAISSLLAQTYEHLEIVVVDDGSNDGSPDRVAGLRDARIRLVRQEHRGLVATLNHGCALAQGEYIARLDADDLAHPRRIAAQLEFLAGHPEVGLLGTWAELAGDRGVEGTFEPPASDPELRRYLLWDSPFVHSSVMFRSAALRGAGGYPEGLAEDYRLWIRIARIWKVAILPEVLVTHRIHQTSYTRTQRRAAALRWRLVAQWEAARDLGPWWAAAPALGVTCGAYLLALAGGGPESAARGLAGRLSRRARGFRAPGVQAGPR